MICLICAQDVDSAGQLMATGNLHFPIVCIQLKQLYQGYLKRIIQMSAKANLWHQSMHFVVCTMKLQPKTRFLQTFVDLYTTVVAKLLLVSYYNLVLLVQVIFIIIMLINMFKKSSYNHWMYNYKINIYTYIRIYVCKSFLKLKFENFVRRAIA